MTYLLMVAKFCNQFSARSPFGDQGALRHEVSNDESPVKNGECLEDSGVGGGLK